MQKDKSVSNSRKAYIGAMKGMMALSVAGFLPLWAAVLGDTGVMLLAVLNSMRMRAKL